MVDNLSKKILVTGAAGQLGRELCLQLGSQALPLDRQTCDLADDVALGEFMAHCQPAAIINSAAYTQVDLAESERERCLAVNAGVVVRLARWAESLNIPLVQISTDYLFGGDYSPRVPHREEDQTEPRGVYAQSKQAGEQVAARWSKHLIVRTCGLYARPSGEPVRGRNFVDTMRVLGRDRTTLRVVQDQHCTPTFVPDLARAILFLLSHNHYGTFHVVNGGEVTWYEFASEIFRLERRSLELIPITSAEYNAPAPRPAYSVLSTAKYEATEGPKLRTWQEALAEYFAS
ncbi:MAG: dTDP-4-dehydrorhamnose reductase [Planctomycetota bacterium]